MTELVVCLGNEKTETYVRKLIEAEKWEKVVLVAGEKQEKFAPSANVKIIVADPKLKFKELVQELAKSLSKEAKGMEVAVNTVAAEGKIGMAVIAALISSGKGIRLVAWSKEGLVVF